MTKLDSIRTPFTEMLGIRFPIIGAPMFLVSNVDMVVAVSEAGGIGTFPSLNFRPSDKYREALQEVRRRTQQPIGVNIIVNKSNPRQKDDLRHSLDFGVELYITSLGHPGDVIRAAHANGAKVFCDVTNLEHAKKVQDLGADGVIAVATGAGGHPGPIASTVLIPWLSEKLSIPVVAAGGVASGRTMAAMISLGACAVSVGTRFIASHEANVPQEYKDAILQSSPEDIVMTRRISGTPASVINTPYVKSLGTDLPWWLEGLKSNPRTKAFGNTLIHWLGMRSLEKSTAKASWKSVWGAGQTVGLIEEELSCQEIVDTMVSDYRQVLSSMPL
jgi:nitronate monooxygenase